MRWNLYYNQEFTEGLTREELEGVLVHEIMHLLRKHHIRARAIDAKKLEWNCAADAEINDDIISDSMKLPEGGVFPSTLKMSDNLLAEEYYAKILENPDLIKGYRDLNCGSCAHGIPEDWEDALNKACEGLSEGEAELVRRQVAEAIAGMPAN